ncbi:hypothetical protein [Pedobacter sp. UBA5917]|jgi:ribosome-associated toxin RatA of RatAB toxin-antitoxin module|uniref:hypothetical protein n=1 Tax=Pedobacter sp. UBA5917 TaxID=1947061 RepID=UPI0025D4A92E|nr:hypothetical protein [Pedobacter sp. UBA5917]
MMAYVHMRLLDHSAAALEEFQSVVASYPEVLEYCHTTGQTFDCSAVLKRKGE